MSSRKYSLHHTFYNYSISIFNNYVIIRLKVNYALLQGSKGIIKMADKLMMIHKIAFLWVKYYDIQLNIQNLIKVSKLLSQQKISSPSLFDHI